MQDKYKIVVGTEKERTILPDMELALIPFDRVSVAFD